MSGTLRAHVDVSLLWERQPEQVAHVAQQHVKADIFTAYVKGGDSLLVLCRVRTFWSFGWRTQRKSWGKVTA